MSSGVGRGLRLQRGDASAARPRWISRCSLAGVGRHPPERLAGGGRAVQHPRLLKMTTARLVGAKAKRVVPPRAAHHGQGRIVQTAPVQHPAIVAGEGRGAVQRDRPQILPLGGRVVADVGGEQAAVEGVRPGRRRIERQRFVHRRPHRRHGLRAGPGRYRRGRTRPGRSRSTGRHTWNRAPRRARTARSPRAGRPRCSAPSGTGRAGRDRGPRGSPSGALPAPRRPAGRDRRRAPRRSRPRPNPAGRRAPSR